VIDKESDQRNGSADGARETYLIVINSLGAGGAERSLADILPHLVKSGVHPIVACFKSPDVGFEEEVRSGGIDVRVLDPASMAGEIAQIRRIIRSEKPSLVYTALFDAHIAGRIAATGTGVPVLSNLTNVAYDPARYLDPNVNSRRLRLIRHVDGWTARHLTTHFHAVSGAVKDSAVDSLGVDASSVTVVYRGRHLHRLGSPGSDRKRRVRESLGIASAQDVLISVGRQEYQKGHRYLLEAMPALIERHPDVLVLIVGRTGHSTAELERIVDSLDISDHVRFLGHRTDIPDLLAAADMFVFPSVYEGLGGAALEAMALGLPMVVSDVPALREVVEEGVNGIVVPPADAGALADGIDELLDDESLMARFGVRSREIFEEKFDADDAIPATVELMHRVSGQGR
jgi:glycosyltransferase involved in cell wall biosynthesis